MSGLKLGHPGQVPRDLRFGSELKTFSMSRTLIRGHRSLLGAG
jgi:hypothetical protein